MIKEQGSISVNATNIFPIIKKWLYSDKDIFLRELISNSNDAITKLKRLSSMGEAQLEDDKLEIRVILNKKKKTISIVDNGIGMTADEVKKYINQVAFSGAEEFLKKYEQEKDESSQIIGHFGLGFYSAFMVAERVEIDTRSYIEDAEAVKWSSTSGIEYEMDTSDKAERGTVITLHMAKDSEEFLNELELKQILEKYCAFLPIEIYLEDEEEKAEKQKAEKEKKKKAKKEEKKADKEDTDEGKDESEPVEPEEGPINDTNPLWLKNPSDCTDEEYKDFYKRVFMDFQDPLFWIHLNVDYPFRLKGILYFPKLANEYETLEGRVKLYNNQVFVADNIKEVIPEFLLLLKGVIDCPDLPLNVSRSFLQNDGQVKKISEHITKKVADKLTGMFKNEREAFDRYWDDINPFIKYGCMRDDKFYDRVKDILIFKATDGQYTALKDYLDRNKDKHKDQVFYITDEKQQAQYIRMFEDYGLEALHFTTDIDSAFINFLEMKESGVKFNRVDSDISDLIKDEDAKDEDSKEALEALEKLFKEALGQEDLKVSVEALKTKDTPAIMLLSEQSRRMQEMSRRFGGGMGFGGMPTEETLVLNISNPLVKRLLEYEGSEDKKEDSDLICKHIYDLAMISLKPLEPAEMTEFIKRSNLLLTRLAD
ncbi:MAG TPA: molecular chaperone HtpG [Bacillota bacterium]|nr:molecular chaperone HtpG [Bacillota bacterium]